MNNNLEKVKVDIWVKGIAFKASIILSMLKKMTKVDISVKESTSWVKESTSWVKESTSWVKESTSWVKNETKYF